VQADTGAEATSRRGRRVRQIDPRKNPALQETRHFVERSSQSSRSGVHNGCTRAQRFFDRRNFPFHGFAEDCTGSSEQTEVAEPRGKAARARTAARGVFQDRFSRAQLWSIALALAAGAALRLLFILVFPDLDGDSDVYATIAKNMLLHHAYALDDPFRSTLIRLPGYPVFIAVIFIFTGIKNYFAVRYAQAVLDMASCMLIALFVRDHAGRRAGLFALWIACLCPFTANYVAIPLTETPEIFAIALGMFSAGRLIDTINTGVGRKRVRLLITAAALILAIGFRPDGVLLAAVIVPGIWWYTRRGNEKAGLRAAAIVAVLAVLPLVPWTIRNERVFHVFQPLAPRSAMDPNETPLEGFNLWTTTWEADYVSLGEIWWRGDDLAIDIHLLPSRAFDSPEEYRETAKLIADYNDLQTITPQLDARFQALAEQRIRRHPLRQDVELPATRLVDMWFRPRTDYLEMLPLRWWEWSKHPEGSLIAIMYALLNALLLAAAAWGFARRRVPFRDLLLAYMLLRCIVLWRMPNAEPRYTLECFPMVFVGAAVALSGNVRKDGERSDCG
jgi:4-amino-4-deoxy-L-arabinose transferase-like glycosyltransferase